MLNKILTVDKAENIVKIFGIDFNLNQFNEIIYKIILVVIIFIAILLIIKFGNKLIDKIVKKQIESNYKFSIDEKKANTLGSLLKSILKYAVYALGVISIICVFVENTTSLAVISSVGGVAIGFGAQSFVKDLINGIFILFEDQYGVGDYITIDKYTGIVESVGIRSTTLRAFSGDHHIIPNGFVNVVTNHTKGNVQIKVEVEIAYEESIDNSISVIRRVCERFSAENDNVVDGPKVIGVTAFGASGMTIKIVGDVKPMTQWVTEAELRKKIKEELDKEGIEIPYNKVKIVNEMQNV
ncbi:MAG: mechanosensitive ion channel family protein [Sarcina sp.]